jgi:hypothetical protein
VDKFKLRVKINSNRPDFRLFATYLFGDDLHHYDSDGNSYPVNSRVWTELYMSSRKNPKLSFEITKENEQPLIFEVSSGWEVITNVISYFLARETSGEILDNNNQSISLDILKNKMGDFNLDERLLLADKSIWRQSSDQNPYPNLTT